jgi:hypothetical protein
MRSAGRRANANAANAAANDAANDDANDDANDGRENRVSNWCCSGRSSTIDLRARGSIGAVYRPSPLRIRCQRRQPHRNQTRPRRREPS